VATAGVPAALLAAGVPEALAVVLGTVVLTAAVAGGAVAGLVGVDVAAPPQADSNSPLPPMVSAERNRRRENDAGCW
jgi:hypothetical protein